MSNPVGFVLNQQAADGVKQLLKYPHVVSRDNASASSGEPTLRWISLTGLEDDGYASGSVFIKSKSDGSEGFDTVRVDTDQESGDLYCECIGYDDDGDLWFTPVFAPTVQWIHITSVGDGCNRKIYNGQFCSKLSCGNFEDAGSLIGSLGVQMVVTTIAPGTDSTPAEWQITYSTAPTFGTFTLRLCDAFLDCTDYVCNFDISAGDMESTLPDTSVFFGGSTYTITSTTNGVRTLELVDVSDLEPPPQRYLIEPNGFDLACTSTSFYAILADAFGKPGTIKVAKTTVDDAVEWTLTEDHVTGGSWRAKIDGGTYSDYVRWDVSSADLETALNTAFDPITCTVTQPTPGGPYYVTITSDDDDHTLTLDKSKLFGDRYYEFLVPCYQKVAVVTDVTCSGGALVLTKRTIWTATCSTDDTPA